jgi:hypothetical protein
MLISARIISALVVMTFGFAWTVGQAGLETTNRNLCDLARAVWFRPIADCQIANWIVWLWGIGAIFALVFLIADGTRWVLRRRGQPKSRWRNVPATESNLSAYIRSSTLVQRLDDEIARNEKLQIKPDETTAILEQENARFFGITDVARIDELLEENQEAVLRIASYSFREDHISRGASIACLFDVLGAQLGEDRLRELNMLRQWQHITDSGIQNRINAYSEFIKNHKIKVRVPLVPDFNLVSIEEGLSIAREGCQKSIFAKSLPQDETGESELLAYFERLKGSLPLYGSLRGRDERMPLGRWAPDQFPLFMLSPIAKNPRFELGKIVVDSQLFGNDSTGNLAAKDVIYERLYVLRPDLTNVIDKLKKAKA